MAATPTTAAKTARTTRMPVTRTVLSLEPKFAMAKFLTGGGARLMAASPTTAQGAPWRTVRPETNWPTPMATAAVSTPTAAPYLACRRRKRAVARRSARAAGSVPGPGSPGWLWFAAAPVTVAAGRSGPADLFIESYDYTRSYDCGSRLVSQRYCDLVLKNPTSW